MLTQETQFNKLNTVSRMLFHAIFCDSKFLLCRTRKKLLSLRLFRVSTSLSTPFLVVIGETARWFFELCNYLGFVLRLTAGRIIARSSDGGGTRWPPTSRSSPTWCRPVQPWPGSPINSRSSGWRWRTWKLSEVSNFDVTKFYLQQSLLCFSSITYLIKLKRPQKKRLFFFKINF